MESLSQLSIRDKDIALPSQQKLQELQLNSAIRFFDSNRGKNFLELCGYGPTTQLYKEYDKIADKIAAGKVKNSAKVELVAKFMLSTYRIVKLKEVNVFYVEDSGSILYKRCSSFESLKSEISLFYQILFGVDDNIKDVVVAIENGILPKDLYSEIDRTYIQICDGYYWSRKKADIATTLGDPLYDTVPDTARSFAKMFDTDTEDKNIFKVPKFDDEDISTMLSVYETLKDKDYYDWPDEYHFQCFKDWSKDRLGVAYGMMAVPALPFMRILPRGSIFNDGDGHNGKSVLNGLAVSILGKNNVSMVKGAELGDWDHLVNFQTTWLNIPNETTIDFLQNNTEAFKAMSAQESIDIPKKHGDAAISINCDFPMVFNINKLPEFSEDASAVLSRMFINKFDVDFEKEGRVIKDYAKKVFLSDKKTMPTIVGAVLAYAHYYSQDEHIWGESPEMASAKESLSESAVPRKTYYQWFSLFFSSFDGIKMVKNDFMNYGSEEGEQYNASDVSMKQRPFSNSKRVCDSSGTFYKIDEDGIAVFNRFRMTDKLKIRKYMGSMDLGEYIGDGVRKSIVHAMRDDYLIKKTQYIERLKIAGVAKTEQEIHKYVMQQMYEEIMKEGVFDGFGR